MSDSDATRVAIDADVVDEGTLVTVAGTRDAAVIVYSESGEEIYLPPEDFEDPIESLHSPIDSPYEGTLPESHYDPDVDGDANPYDPVEDDPKPNPYDRAEDEEANPYDRAEGEEPNPYAATGEPNTGHGPGGRIIGVESTRTGFRVVHPEPIHDIRVIRPPVE